MSSINVGKPTTSEWLNLITRSHQTSLYVLPEWLKLHEVETLVARNNSGVLAGLVVSPTHTPLPFCQYQGLLLTRKEQPKVVERLLREVEAWDGPKAVWCAPSLVDTRPFSWRWFGDHVLWRTQIRYTLFLEGTKEEGVKPEEVEVVAPDVTPFERQFSSRELGFLEDIMRFPSVEMFRADAAHVLVGTDKQGRGYLIAGTRGCEPLLLAIASTFPSFDVGGCNSPESNAKWHSLNGKLRTIYGLHL